MFAAYIMRLSVGFECLDVFHSRFASSKPLVNFKLHLNIFSDCDWSLLKFETLKAIILESL